MVCGSVFLTDPSAATTAFCGFDDTSEQLNPITRAPFVVHVGATESSGKFKIRSKVSVELQIEHKLFAASVL